MRFRVSVLVLGSMASAWANAPASSPSPVPSLKSVVTRPVASPAPQALTEGESRSLLREFVKAQRSELKALEHRQKFEMQELKQTQKVARKEWESTEKTARHKFFAENSKGPDRRVYVKDFIKRGDEFRAAQKTELGDRKKAQSDALAALKASQAQRLKEVEDLLAKKQRPPESMWPAAGN